MEDKIDQLHNVMVTVLFIDLEGAGFLNPDLTETEKKTVKDILLHLAKYSVIVADEVRGANNEQD